MRAWTAASRAATDAAWTVVWSPDARSALAFAAALAASVALGRPDYLVALGTAMLAADAA